MIRRVLSALSTRITSGFYFKSPLSKVGTSNFEVQSSINTRNANFTSLVHSPSTAVPISEWASKYTKPILLELPKGPLEQIRPLTKFSWKKGKRKSVKAVRTRFFRLHWGIWIRTMAGRHKKLWKKSASRRNRLLHHVFCNATQSRMLDTMVNRFWRKPKYYIEDPYEPYHKRENFYITRHKPWRPEGVDYE